MSISGRVDDGDTRGVDGDDVLLAISIFVAIGMLAIIVFVLLIPQLTQSNTPAFQTSSFVSTPTYDENISNLTVDQTQQPTTSLKIVYAPDS
jgi:hypothetical protein